MTKQVTMQGTATLTLMANTQNADQFKRLLNKHTIIDAKLNVLTCEGEVVTVDVFEFLQLEWEKRCLECGVSLEDEEVLI